MSSGRSVYLSVVWTIVVALIISYLIVFAVSAAVRSPLPVEFMYGESIVLDLSRRVAQGEALYPAPDHLPLAVTAYTPLYYLLVGELQRVFGDGYLPGRLVSLASAGGAAAAIVFGVRRPGGRWHGGLLAAGIFLTQNMTVLLWAPLHRVDLLALCLTLVGLTLAARGRLLWSAPFFVLAAFTKQTYMAAPLAVCATLAPDWRAALRFALVYGAGLAAATLTASVFTDGWFLWHTVIANANPFDEQNLFSMISAFLHFNGVPLLAAIALFSLPWRLGERLWRLYFLASFLTFPAIGKMGASSNYWLEETAAIAILIGVLADRLATCAPSGAAVTELGLALLVAGSLLVPIPGYRAVAGEALHSLPDGNVAAIHSQLAVAPLVAAEPGEVLTDEPALAVAARKPVDYEFVIFSLLVGQQLWDEQPIIEAIKTRRFSLVVLSIPLDAPPEQARWSPALIAALKASYAQAGYSDSYWLYRPVNRDGGG